MPITVVSNSSPIIHLAKIDQLNLLSDFFGELIIPPAVYAECITEGKGRPEVARIKQASWLRVVPVANQNLITLLNAEIDRSEAEAIALALETQAALLLLDDADAREKARLYHLNNDRPAGDSAPRQGEADDAVSRAGSKDVRPAAPTRKRRHVMCGRNHHYWIGLWCWNGGVCDS